MNQILIESDGTSDRTFVWLIDEKGNKINEIMCVSSVNISTISNDNGVIKATLEIYKPKLNIKAEIEEVNYE